MNSRGILVIAALLFAGPGCASERLYVRVVDDDGHPVSNATVNVDFTSGHIVLGDGTDHHYEAKTDTNGNAVVKFNCKTSDIGWHVEADGYYRSDPHDENFKGEDVIIPPGIGFVVLHEHEKRGEVTLYRKKNPQPMYAYTREMDVKAPIANGRYGFDLQCFDWLPPLGGGKIADFYYVRERPDETNMTKRVRYNNSGYYQFKNGESGYPKLGEVVGRIEFDENCGAYIDKQTGCESFPSTHCADPRREYVRSIPISIVFCDEFHIWVYESTVVDGSEYMVIRSRVKCDENGNIVSANYSKVLGPAGFAGLVNFRESVFNPRPNDTNLEFDPNRNLYKGRKGGGRIP